DLSVILTLFKKSLSNKLIITKKISQNDALRYVSEFYAYLFLIDTSHGRPKGYYVPFLSLKQSSEYMDTVFDGYVFALQFLWYRLLGHDEFSKSCVKDLHHCKDIQLSKKSATEEDYDYGDEELLGIKVTPEEKKEREYRTIVRKKWLSVDRFFNKIKHEIIRPLEERINHNFGGFDTGLIQLKTFEKSVLDAFLQNTPPEPDYLTRTDLKSMKKRLDVKFLWYDIDALDGADANLEFNGAFAFISLLTGYANILQEEGSDGKIRVKKIIHPSHMRDTNYYSLAILIGSYGFFSDSSGWIVFYNCLIDSPGTGGHYRDMCFDRIQRLASRVELEEITVDKETFLEYLQSRKVSSFKTTDALERNREDDGVISHARGKLFEYVFLKYCLDNKKYDSVRGDFPLHGEQIDCLAIKDKLIHVFECKLQVHDDLKESKKQVARKIKAVEKEYPDHQIVPFITSYSPVMEERQSKILKSGIKVIQNFKNILQNEREFDGERKKLLSILNSETNDTFSVNYDRDWFT
ncbi:MAG: hypothetical protein QXG97_05455, partial [Nitrososphaerota archaeon]